MHENDQALDEIVARERGRMQVIDVPGENLSSLPKEAAQLAVVPAPTAEELVTLRSMGIVLPLVTPEALRRAFAYRQQIYAAILDEGDYVYVATFREGNKDRQAVFTKRADAIKFAEGNGVEYRGVPKKSGIVKLAGALAINAKRKSPQGLPDDPKASYASVVYEATYASHPNLTAEGIGMCDASERRARVLSSHEIVATADTRAYNRSVLRLVGFGDVSAEEIVAAGAWEDEEAMRGGKAIVQSDAPLRDPDPLPSILDDNVLTAARMWAEQIAKRPGERWGDPRMQNGRTAVELRAKARRGDSFAANQMGVSGLHWEGEARDSQLHRSFTVEASPVDVEDIFAARAAAAQERSEADRDNGPPTTPSGVPTPSSDEAISMSEAKHITDTLLRKFGMTKPLSDENKQTVKKWLRENASVETTALIKRSQFGRLMSLLEG